MWRAPVDVRHREVEYPPLNENVDTFPVIRLGINLVPIGEHPVP